jgi:hypothetical protein
MAPSEYTASSIKQARKTIARNETNDRFVTNALCSSLSHILLYSALQLNMIQGAHLSHLAWRLGWRLPHILKWALHRYYYYYGYSSYPWMG